MSSSAFDAVILFGSMILMCVWTIGSSAEEERFKPNWMGRLFVGNLILLFVALFVGIEIKREFGLIETRKFYFWYMHVGPPVWMFVVLTVAVLCDLWKNFLFGLLKEVFTKNKPRKGVFEGKIPNDWPYRLDLSVHQQKEGLSGVVVTDDVEIGSEFEDDPHHLHAEALSLTAMGSASSPK